MAVGDRAAASVVSGMGGSVGSVAVRQKGIFRPRVKAGGSNTMSLQASVQG